MLFTSGVMAIFGLWILKYLITDLSFQSKFLILEEALNIYKTADFRTILFGLGLSETEQLMTHSAHNYFLFLTVI